MPLSSPRFATVAQCRDAAVDRPPMRAGSQGAGVAAVQQALIDLGFPLPASTRRFGAPDGRYGTETASQVHAFQRRSGLVADGVVGRQTMERLDTLLRTPRLGSPELPFVVSGRRVVIAQPSSMVCWATVHAMMRSWKFQASFGIRQAAAAVGERYGALVDANRGLPSEEFGPFITAAGMAVQPMMNLSIPGWLSLLRRRGLIWVGTLNSIGPEAGLHSRIVEGMSGDGTVDGTELHMIDPDGGRRYHERFRLFIAKYEGAIRSVDGEYFQIRYFR
jgi:peptidoglycan hydrolase-like protein with peptidoglycan-binding domain